MANKLQEHFAMIRDREEVLNDIRSREEFLEMYQLWSDERRELFLDYFTGITQTIDQMKNTIKENAVEIDYQKTQINKQKEALNDRDKLLEEQRLRIAQPEAQLKKNV